MAVQPHRPARRGVSSLLGALLLTLAALVAAPGIGHAAPPRPAPGAPLDTAAVVGAVEPGLVQITTLVDFQGVIGNGAGIVLTPDGQVLTNHHVVQGANSIRVSNPTTGQHFDADVLGFDRDDDIALLQLRGAFGLPVAPLGDSNTVAVGEPVVTIGNANGTGNPFTHEQGEVTGLNRQIDAEDEMTGASHSLGGLIQSSTNLRSGDSGGALVNGAGQVIGMNAAATYNFRMDGASSPGGEGFAIPINEAIGIANQIRSGLATPEVHIGPSAMLGIGIDADNKPRDGLPIRSILRGGPAEQAGMRPGDILTVIDGTPVNTANTLTALMDQRYPGNIIDVTWVNPAGQIFNAKITLVPGPVG